MKDFKKGDTVILTERGEAFVKPQYKWGFKPNDIYEIVSIYGQYVDLNYGNGADGFYIKNDNDNQVRCCREHIKHFDYLDVI